MAQDNKRSSEEEEETTRPRRDYMHTWGSTVAVKKAYSDEHEDDEKLSEEEAIKVEAKRPGVNPSISPAIDASGKPLAQ